MQKFSMEDTFSDWRTEINAITEEEKRLEEELAQPIKPPLHKGSLNLPIKLHHWNSVSNISVTVSGREPKTWDVPSLKIGSYSAWRKYICDTTTRCSPMNWSRISWVSSNKSARSSRREIGQDKQGNKVYSSVN